MMNVMTQAPGSQISFSDTCYYHLIFRCIRCAFLSGEDEYTKNNDGHSLKKNSARLTIQSYSFASYEGQGNRSLLGAIKTIRSASGLFTQGEYYGT